MTNSERAEKILSLCNIPTTDSAYIDPRNGLPLFLKRDIIRELDEAVAIAVREAVEKAAGIAELHSAQSFGYSTEQRVVAKDIAERVRSMTND